MGLEDLIGLPAKDPRLLDFVRQLGEEPRAFEMGDEDPTESAVLTLKQNGLQISFGKQGTVNSIHSYAQGVHGYEQYPGALPLGLSFATTQDEARALLGPPTRSGGPIKAILGGGTHLWDRWDREGFVLHLQYPEGGGGVEMLTLMHPDRAPG